MSDLERARAMPAVGHLQLVAGAFVVLGMLWGVGAAAPPPVLHTFHGTASGDGFGSAVAFGDVNGDGIPDVIIGAAKNGDPSLGPGYVQVFDGAAVRAGLPDKVLYTFYRTQAGSWFGDHAVTAGDVNGDGKADIIVGAHFGTVTDANGPSGYIRVFNGATGALLYQFNATAHGEGLGEAVAAADVDLNGKANVAVGSPGGSSHGLTGNGFVQLLGD